MPVRFNHARIARLDRAELRVIANLRQPRSGTIDYIYQPLSGLDQLCNAVNQDADHLEELSQTPRARTGVLDREIAVRGPAFRVHDRLRYARD